jgi:hypothetical protein
VGRVRVEAILEGKVEMVSMIWSVAMGDMVGVWVGWMVDSGIAGELCRLILYIGMGICARPGPICVAIAGFTLTDDGQARYVIPFERYLVCRVERFVVQVYSQAGLVHPVHLLARAPSMRGSGSKC